ncbi:MAG: glycosyltransferase family 4 protein [Planctomycetaceae bacterium]
MIRPAPRLCFVGPHVGVHPGMVPTQALLLCRRFRASGRAALSCSSARSRTLRLLDTLRTLVWHRRRYDIGCVEVFSGRAFVIADLASLVARMLGKRLVLALHGGGLPAFAERHPRWVRRVLARADRVVAPSRFLAQCAAGSGRAARIIPNGLDLASYPWRLRGPCAPRLFWMRTFHPVWNPALAVRVLARVRATLPEATLVMAGQDRGEQGAVKRLAGELGVGSAVRFPGFLDGEGKAREGGGAEIFLNTNRVDNAPVAVLEACALGLPVVSTAVGGIPDLLRDGETGLLVPEGDAEAMAAAVVRLLRDAELARSLSRNGRRLAEACDWGVVQARWEELFCEVHQGETR